MTSPFLTSPALSAIPNIRHGFFTRQGGVSDGLYDSLNCGWGSKDDRQRIIENRARVAGALGARELMTAYQIHSTTIHHVDAPFEGRPPDGDGLITTTPGLALGALAADCAPILFASKDGRVVASAHSGWKGALNDIAGTVAAKMEALGVTRRDIVAAVGPCISQASYEVGPEFRDRFTEIDPAFDAYFAAGREGHFHFDLPGFVRLRLEQAEIGTIDVLGLDTFSDPERFFSYRRTTHAGDPDYGRQVSAIAIGFEAGA
jgi:YfiH family protein